MRYETLSEQKHFTTDELFENLKALAKRFRKLNGKMFPAEIYLVGGASILLNYSFRNMTCDVDAVICASSAMKDAIRDVANERNLPIDWLNSDFQQTESYSPKIMQYSNFRCELNNILRVYTISAEYLIAMKLMAGRKYKHDLSDVIGILAEHNDNKNGNEKAPITLDMIKNAVINLYGDWNKLPEYSRVFIENAISTVDYSSLLKKTQDSEARAANNALEFQDKYPNVLNTNNINEILSKIEAKKTSQISFANPYFIEVKSKKQLDELKKQIYALKQHRLKKD